ncbi:hypothetical protein BH10BAC5_BH10BAC5_16690 [soil metagenome]
MFFVNSGLLTFVIPANAGIQSIGTSFKYQLFILFQVPLRYEINKQFLRPENKFQSFLQTIFPAAWMTQRVPPRSRRSNQKREIILLNEFNLFFVNSGLLTFVIPANAGIQSIGTSFKYQLFILFQVPLRYEINK